MSSMEQRSSRLPLESWRVVDEFLSRERDRFHSSVTHIHLSFAAALILSILLGGYGLLSPFSEIAELDRREMDGEESIFIMFLAFTVLVVLGLTILALHKIKRALVRSLEEDLKGKAKSVRFMAGSFGLNLPSSTATLLESIETL